MFFWWAGVRRGQGGFSCVLSNRAEPHHVHARSRVDRLTPKKDNPRYLVGGDHVEGEPPEEDVGPPVPTHVPDNGHGIISVCGGLSLLDRNTCFTSRTHV